jgi:hypothetical protein
MGKTILHVFILVKKIKLLFPESACKLRETILNVFFNKEKIMNKSPKHLLQICIEISCSNAEVNFILCYGHKR